MSSVDIGWSRLVVERYHGVDSIENLVTPASDKLSIVFRESGSQLIESRDGELTRTAVTSPGSYGLTPPGRTNSLRWQALGDAPGVSLHISIEPKYISDAARAYGLSIDLTRLDALELRSSQVTRLLHRLGQTVLAGGDEHEGEKLVVSSLGAIARDSLTARPMKIDHSSVGFDVIARAITFIEEHLHVPVSVQELADRAFSSRYHFARRFEHLVGASPSAFMRKRRLERAAELLAQTQLPIGDIMELTAWTSRSHFAEAFRQQYHDTPRAYRISPSHTAVT